MISHKQRQKSEKMGFFSFLLPQRNRHKILHFLRHGHTRLENMCSVPQMFIIVLSAKDRKLTKQYPYP